MEDTTLFQKIFFTCTVLLLVSLMVFDYLENELQEQDYRWPKIDYSADPPEWSRYISLPEEEEEIEGNILEMPEELKKENSHLPLNETMKKILIWTDGYGDGVLGYGHGHEPFLRGKCKISNCYVTNNRSLIPVEHFDALVFHFRGLKTSDLPNKRSRSQRWVFYEKESSSYIYQNPRAYNGLFNWTMTYKSNSDVWASYGHVFPNPKYKKSENVTQVNFAEGKTELAAWFVSNCWSHSLRRRFVNEMTKYMKVDVYGKCGHLSCPRTDMEGCYKMVEKKYKFYLAYENSLCKDYVTEKFFNALRYNIVPVVYGLGDYSRIAPPHSYINALAFPNVEKLTDYLKYLDKNDTAYNEYFKWKPKYLVRSGWSSLALEFCNLCSKLHEDLPPKVYDDMGKWFVLDTPCKTLSTNSWLNWLQKKSKDLASMIGESNILK